MCSNKCQLENKKPFVKRKKKREKKVSHRYSNYEIFVSVDGSGEELGAVLAPHAVAFVRVDVSVRIDQRKEQEVELVQDAVIFRRVVDQLLDHVRQRRRRDPLASVDSCFFCCFLN